MVKTSPFARLDLSASSATNVGPKTILIYNKEVFNLNLIYHYNDLVATVTLYLDVENVQH